LIKVKLECIELDEEIIVPSQLEVKSLSRPPPSTPEVYKVPEPANLVRRKYLKISLLAENFYQNLRIENMETFTGLFQSHRKFSEHINLMEKNLIFAKYFLYTSFSQKDFCTQYSC
jgi:hypothetical protein